jgi:hypothetical protein
MPKRTNDFQKLIKRIYEQIADKDDKVTESALVKENRSSTEREIDILLEKRMFGTSIKIAVECRGRERKDDIEWIDGLIGKFRDLDIQKVIAVSRSGFSPSAIEKANENHIDVLTLREALEKDWSKEFIRLGIGQIDRTDFQLIIEISSDPPLQEQLLRTTELINQTGENVGNLEDVARFIYESMKNDIDIKIGNEMTTLFKTVEGITSNELITEITKVPTRPTFILDTNRIKYRITNITLKIRSSFSFKAVTDQNFILGKTVTTLGAIETLEGGGIFSIMAVQTTDKPNQAKLQIWPK